MNKQEIQVKTLRYQREEVGEVKGNGAQICGDRRFGFGW